MSVVVQLVGPPWFSINALIPAVSKMETHSESDFQKHNQPRLVWHTH